MRNISISWGQGAPIGAALEEFGDLVSGGDAGSLFETLESAIRATDEGTRGKVLAPWSCWVGSTKRFATTPWK